MICIKPKQIIHPIKKITNETIQVEQTEYKVIIHSDSEWSNDKQDLEQYFNSIEIPTHSIQLNKYMNILNLSKFIQCNLNNLKTYEENSYFLPHLERLQTIKQYLEHG